MSADAETVSVPAAARVLGVHHSTLWRAIKQGRCPFPTVQILGATRVSKRILDRYLAGELSEQTLGGQS